MGEAQKKNEAQIFHWKYPALRSIRMYNEVFVIK